MELVREQIADIALGSVFLFIGIAACFVAAIRRRGAVRLLVWLGLWSGLYGIGLLTRSPILVAALPPSIQATVVYVNTAIAYLLVVVASFAFRELSLGNLRLLMGIVILAGTTVALAGIGWFVFGGSADRFILHNHAVAVCGLIILVAVVGVKKLSDKFLVLPNRRVLAFGTLVFATEALWVNLSRDRYQTPHLLDALGFAVFLLSFGYAAVQIVFANERRLLAIEKELEIARRLQESILPASVPEMPKLRIAAAYRPMAAVAGDFYEFIPIDETRLGILVADVTGHGVPAALIASMIKVATQSVAPCAHDPRQVLSGLNRVLFGQLRNQFITAAYFSVDTENGTASYSAAGHPPLIRWREGNLERIESNGLLFGVVPEPEYPLCTLSIRSGDRFLLYTDGVIEAENASGDSFGDRKLEEVVRKNQSRPPSALLDQLLSDIAGWQAASVAQQDDITLLIVDVV
jgi:sigma-B regulation protein RsbU (phosphoserine phosphatase)